MFLSIIIPIYNTEKYLDECIQSLLKQDISAEDYQIICVNDGSTDGSLNILQKYEAETSNIIVVNQKNSGVCVARNAGIDIADGDYIWFIDSDDYIEKDILGNLMHKAYSENYDRVIFGNYYFIDGKNSTEGMTVNTSWSDSIVWRSIFKREFIVQNNLYFHYGDLVYGEDALYMYEVKRCYPKTLEIAQPIYYHRDRPCSAGTEQNTPEEKRKKLVSNLRESQIMQKYYESGDSLPETADRLMSFLWGTLYRIAELPSDQAALYLKELKECGLYPYKRPDKCTITKSYQLFRNDFIEKVFDKIYTNLHTRWGYRAMRCWFGFFKIKQRITVKKLI